MHQPFIRQWGYALQVQDLAYYNFPINYVVKCFVITGSSTGSVVTYGFNTENTNSFSVYRTNNYSGSSYMQYLSLGK